MKLECEGTALSEAVSKVSKALPVKALDSNHLLECIKIEAYGEQITLFATDGELAISKTIECKNIFEEGSVAIPGKLLVELSRKLSNEQIEITMSDNYRMRVRYAESELYIQCFDSFEYPAFRALENPQCVKILAGELKDLITKTIFCVSMDNARAVLKGCYFQAEEYRVTAVALDGYRLMRISKPIEAKTEKLTAIIPGRSLGEVLKIIDKNEEVVGVFIEKDYVLFDFGHTKLLARLLSGRFMEYEQIIPKEFCTEITVNRDMFLKSVDRAGTISKKTDLKASVVNVSVRENIMTIKGNSEVGNITENIPITMKGKDLQIAFNVRYLMEFLNAGSEEFLRMKFSSNIAPCVIEPIDENLNYMYLVLPIRLTNN